MEGWQEVSFLELEMFVTQKHHVTIIPSFSTVDPIHLLIGSFGPFRSNLEIDVPLWLALELKQQGKCRLTPPPWLTVEQLEALCEKQKSEPELIKLPHDEMFEIGYIFLNKAPNDLTSHMKVRSRLEDLENIRGQRLKKLFSPISSSEREDNEVVLGPLRIKNITPYEVNVRRGTQTKIMEDYHRILPYRKRQEEHY